MPKFVHASRFKNWLMHLSAVDQMIPAIIAMDRIKYRRMLPVYLADMLQLEHDDPAIWKHFMEGNFSVQKSKIPFTALGRDHAGEQQNKIMKIEGGLKGISKEENARVRHFLTAPVLQEIYD